MLDAYGNQSAPVGVSGPAARPSPMAFSRPAAARATHSAGWRAPISARSRKPSGTNSAAIAFGARRGNPAVPRHPQARSATRSAGRAASIQDAPMPDAIAEALQALAAQYREEAAAAQPVEPGVAGPQPDM